MVVLPLRPAMRNAVMEPAAEGVAAAGEAAEAPLVRVEVLVAQAAEG